MNLLALKVFLLSRVFLGSTATILLILAAIAFNWMDSYHLVRNGLETSIEWVDTLNEWGSKTQHTAEKVNEAINKAQQEFQK
ncbi:MAG: hypothetical protein B7Z05_08640 [Thiotrichales bacterium 32-46-8]|nr:hypothetical protein [Gammaproteobacteria bacterium]OYX04282.1 MAG: hypothetical protein B7Z05_08640 [Thiotrichales bacterium 32-46-8]HQT05088.1 hypothetical protein [Thiotrichales bacterium]